MGRLDRIQSSTWFRLTRYYNEHSSVHEVAWLWQNNYHTAEKNHNGPILHRRIKQQLEDWLIYAYNLMDQMDNPF